MHRLVPDMSALLVVDVQERLAQAMPPERLDGLVRRAEILVDAAKMLGVPVVATEQYPKGLGPTATPLRDALARAEVNPLEKLEFSACANAACAAAIEGLPGRAIVVLGMETHICVFQTVRDLILRGRVVFVVSDAVCSRFEDNRKHGLALCERAGAFVAPMETILFDWLGAAGSDAFRVLSKRIRDL